MHVLNTTAEKFQFCLCERLWSNNQNRSRSWAHISVGDVSIYSFYTYIDLQIYIKDLQPYTKQIHYIHIRIRQQLSKWLFNSRNKLICIICTTDGNDLLWHRHSIWPSSGLFGKWAAAMCNETKTFSQSRKEILFCVIVCSFVFEEVLQLTFKLN